MTQWKCHHGKALNEACPACEVETARAFVEHWGEILDAARAVIAEAENQETEASA